STSVLDTDFYTSTDPLQRSFSRPVSEDDDLTGSTKGLATGYGQTKWVLRRTDAGCRCSRIESVDAEAGICDWRGGPGKRRSQMISWSAFSRAACSCRTS